MTKIEFKPKLVIDFETTRSEAVIAERMDAYYDAAQIKIRDIFALDPDVTIIGWHLHKSTGSIDEIEP